MTTLPSDSAARKRIPLYSGPFRMFPAALCEVARACAIGNEKHAPEGTELVHLRGVSGDHADCILRHLVDMEEGSGRDENGVPHVAYVAWRALALAQEWLERNGYPTAPAAKFPGKEPTSDLPKPKGWIIDGKQYPIS